ncbi:MAG: hypothetical protein IT376_00005 [Polyangiaceae bacterium]|nr:hypothetical protein [Polyangiaceae bacterium]
MDFEGATGGFTHAPIDGQSGSSWTFDHWEHGTATSGPGACHGGTGCWATHLAGNYVQCGRAMLRSPVIDLSACAGDAIKFTFWHWYDFQSPVWNGTTYADGGLVEVSGDGGSTWHAATLTYPGTIEINGAMGWGYSCNAQNSFYVDGQPGFIGSSGGWVLAELSLPPALRTATARVRFVYSSGVSYQTTSQSVSMTYTAPGWYLDDVAVVAE